MNRTDLHELADLRIAEAVALLSLPVPMPDGAYYLAGYAIECALKACIARQVREHDFPDKQLVNESYTHDLQRLIRAADVERQLLNDGKSNPAFEAYWITVQNWNESSRYERHALSKAQKIVRGITDPADGVLPWIKVRW